MYKFRNMVNSFGKYTFSVYKLVLWILCEAKNILFILFFAQFNIKNFYFRFLSIAMIIAHYVDYTHAMKILLMNNCKLKKTNMSK